LKAKTAEGLAKGSISWYAEDLKNFLGWCDGQGIQRVEDLTPDHLRSWLLHLKEEGRNPGGIHGHWRAARSYINWWGQECDPDNWKNPTKRVKPPKVPDVSMPVISLEEVEKLYKAAITARDRAIVLLLCDSGVRAAELLALNIEDIDQYSGEIRVRQGKGGRGRSTFCGRRTRIALRAWVKQRDSLSEALFISSEGGGRLAYSGLRQLLHRLSVRAGIPYFAPHCYRRAFAISAIRNGADLLSVSRMLGHRGLSLLGRYAAQSSADLAIVHGACSPIDRGGR
jgi:integrase/recombinase XerD